MNSQENKQNTRMIVGTDYSRDSISALAGMSCVNMLGDYKYEVKWVDDVVKGELEAILMALRYFNDYDMIILTDSATSISVLKRGLKRYLSERCAIEEAASGRHVELRWVKGHCGEPLNSMAHHLARLAWKSHSWLPDENHEEAAKASCEEIIARYRKSLVSYRPPRAQKSRRHYLSHDAMMSSVTPSLNNPASKHKKPRWSCPSSYPDSSILYSIDCDNHVG